VHASAAGLKGYCCNAAAIGIEELRKCCGGAGYLMASGIAALEADYKWRATAEGDTVVMLLQTARYLAKSAVQAKNGEPLAGLTSCLAGFNTPGYGYGWQRGGSARAPPPPPPPPPPRQRTGEPGRYLCWVRVHAC
jgi:hypothetical protein